ncbi:uncharacterized protein STEHIDRAFT_159981 [Stereum hirsutum FP-91666 SS1]|uniref:uncharacterized protein n=1 Tax=Stereum hirsutum (strain FP-91666) TaxID=721885 RepID=UPI000444A010|nr:uncharacterized protein STEHIDRAFT_159981 [Stereum hirsutum FP-91666 SS1]EIM83400.1 hypothetical protein STEHIDRAFT_159981 [Stereum hirsutum FP-91666 SS1]
MALITRVEAQARVHPPSLHCGSHGVPHPLKCFKPQFDLPRSIALSALSFVAWDVCITFGDEVELIWRTPWNHLKTVYILIRAVLMVSQTPSPDDDSLDVALSRTYDHPRHNALVLNGVRILFVLEVAAVVGLFVYSRPLTHSNSHCKGPSTARSPSQRFLFALPPLIHDSTLFLLTWIKFQTSLRHGWGRVPAVKKFVQDGIWAYALPSAVLLINMGVNVSKDGYYATLVSPWISAVNGFSGYRLVLNLMKMLHEDTVSSLELDSQIDRDSQYTYPPSDRRARTPSPASV